MRQVRVASATLLAIAAVTAADAAPAPAAQPPPQPVREYTTQPTRTVSLANLGDAKLVAKAALFVSDDAGRSWRKDQEQVVAENATALPVFTFTAPKDGAFGLWTVATMRDGRAEPEPVSGAAPKLNLVVDRASPTLERLETTLGGVADGQATLAVSWKIADANLGAEPVSIEVSTDQGKSFAAKQTGAAEGTSAITVSATNAELQVRIVAHDLAGNVLTSAAKAVALPVAAKPADPEAQLAAAVAALPAPAELGVAGRSSSAMVTSGSSPLASAEPAAPAATPAATPAAPGTPAGATPPVAGNEPDVVSNRDVEARYAREAGAPVAQQRGRQLSGETETAAPANQPASNRPTAADAAAPYLTGAAADSALEAARQSDSSGDVDAALGQYLRLHRSSVAKTAISEELALLRRIGDHATIVGIVSNLPPELRTDDARLHAARASLARGDNAAAAAWAAKVRANADEAREALLVLGRALKADGRATDARRVFDRLAGGNDEIAAQARAER
jgi:hypothetical protein